MNEVLRHYRPRAPQAVIPCRSVLPAMRFLRYQQDGGSSPPHVDLTKTGGTRSYVYHGAHASGCGSAIDGTDWDCAGEGMRGTDACIEGAEGSAHEEEDERLVAEVPQQRSSHTFILYLTSCDEGGETALLRQLPSSAAAPAVKECTTEKKQAPGSPGNENKPGVASVGGAAEAAAPEPAAAYDEEANTIVAVRPIRGRLLFFPHNHPHEGRPVAIPRGSGHQKLLLRGEMF